MKTILGLDISSSHIGWCFYDGSDAESGTIKLKADHISQKLAMAELAIGDLVRRLQPSVAAIEGGVFSFASAIIPQQRVAGVVLLTLHKADLLYMEITPTAAKKALTGKGKASKEEMIDAARARLTTSLSWHITKIKGTFCCIDARDRTVLFDEHAADALAVALAAYERFEVKAIDDEAVLA